MTQTYDVWLSAGFDRVGNEVLAMRRLELPGEAWNVAEARAEAERRGFEVIKVYWPIHANRTPDLPASPEALRDGLGYPVSAERPEDAR